MNTWAEDMVAHWKDEYAFDLIILAMSVAIGSICGLVGVRHKPFYWETYWKTNGLAIVLAPVPALVGNVIFLALGDLVTGPHSDSTFFPMLVQSTARALLFAPYMGLIGTPLAMVASVMSQLLFHTVARQWHGR